MKLPVTDCIDWGPPTLDRSDEVKATFTFSYRWKPGGFVRFAAAMGVNLAAIPLPGHDPPVAWRAPDIRACNGLDIVACPAVMFGRTLIGHLPDDIPVLEGEPGRSPVRP